MAKLRRTLARLLTAFASWPLRFKITIPYLVVAILLAGLATWVITQAFVRGLQERFNAQLVDGFEVASSAIFQAESAALSAERALARTIGVPSAVAVRDSAVLDILIRPLAVNSHLGLVHVLDNTGRLVYGLRTTPEGLVRDETADFTAWEAVQRVLAGQSDDLGDKYSTVVEAPWGAVLYVAGPVKDGERLRGVMLVGTPLADLLPRMTADPLAQVTFFAPDGAIVQTTFVEAAALPVLSPETLAAVSSQGTHLLQNQQFTLGPSDYNEAVGPLLLRGQPTGWAVGVALPRSLLTDSARLSPPLLAAVFAAAVLGVIGLGVLVAQAIAHPVFALVRASSRVAEGDLEVAVPELARDELGVLGRYFNAMVVQLRQREFMRDLFGRVVSSDVREALLQGRVQLGGDLKVVTVLFTDVRQFTTYAESHSPEQVVAVLNSYFTVVNSAVREAGGMINKFGGDSTLAIFGAPVNLPPAESARRALRAALAIRTGMTEANARRVLAGEEPISIGIGINTGEVITGNIGSEERFEYTVIGDTVNVAARVQGLTREFTDSNILVTDATVAALIDREQLLLADFGDVALRGRIKQVHVFGVIGVRLAETRPKIRVGGVPRRDVLETLYLFCHGFDLTVIAATKKIPLEAVQWWLHNAAAHFADSSQELRLEFGLSDAELQRLHEYQGEPGQPELSAEMSWSSGADAAPALSETKKGAGA